MSCDQHRSEAAKIEEVIAEYIYSSQYIYSGYSPRHRPVARGLCPQLSKFAPQLIQLDLGQFRGPRCLPPPGLKFAPSAANSWLRTCQDMLSGRHECVSEFNLTMVMEQTLLHIGGFNIKIDKIKTENAELYSNKTTFEQANLKEVIKFYTNTAHS
jgi:hypothetical protein